MNFGTNENIQTILARHSEDLGKIDLKLIEKDAKALENTKLNFKEKLEQLALSCGDKSLIHPQWFLFGGRLLMEIIKSEVACTFSETTSKMESLLDAEYFDYVRNNAKELDEMIRSTNDYNFDIFATATLRKSYLAHLKIQDTSILMETPQYMYLRVATYLHFPDMKSIEETYISLSNGDYAHATPTLFNAGMKKPQLSSCFLGTINDSMDSITKTWKDQAIISMNSGGLGYDYTQLRHSEIGQHGFSRGIVPWLKISNEILKTVDQGGKRKGSGTMYLRDFHVDILDFIELRDEGPEDMRAKDLFLGLMISDLFMSRVKNDEIWSLFCPNRIKGITEVWGDDFEKMYTEAERKNLFSKQIKARDLWSQILKMIIKKGMPFMLSMDAINFKCNQKHSGIVRGSNLCTEIAEITNDKEIASCTLASIALNKCVEYNSQIGKMFFNFDKLEKLSKELVRNLNQVIDRNYYPEAIPEIKYSNMKHRPLGIGVQGFADACALLDISIISPNLNRTRPEPEDAFVLSARAKKLNDQIFETIYFACVKQSIDLAKVHGYYPDFPGSPFSEGKFQYDLWQEEKERKISRAVTKKRARDYHVRPKSRYSPDQWDTLRQDMMRYGTRNSLMTTIMPTASSAHTLGNTEAAEPFGDLITARTVLSGQFIIVNKHLVKDLEELGMWNNKTKEDIIAHRGSIQNILPPLDNVKRERFEFLKLKYATAFEMPQKILLQLAADRGVNICQTQSQNCFMARPTKAKLSAYLFYAHELKLKTWSYYVRQKALTDPINFTIDTSTPVISETNQSEKYVETNGRKRKVVCTDDVCTSCNV